MATRSSPRWGRAPSASSAQAARRLRVEARSPTAARGGLRFRACNGHVMTEPAKGRRGAKASRKRRSAGPVRVSRHLRGRDAELGALADAGEVERIDALADGVRFLLVADVAHDLD